MALVNYDIQKATHTSEETILPVDRAEWADDIKSMEKSISNVVSLASSALKSQKRSGGGSDSTEKNIRVNEMSRDVGELALINEQKPMTESEIIQWTQRIRSKYPDVSIENQNKVLSSHGFQIPDNYFTRKMELSRETNAQNQIVEDAYLEQIALEYGGPKVAGASRADLIAIGDGIVKNSRVAVNNLEILSNPNATEEQKRDSFINASNYISSQIARRIGALQDNLGRPLTKIELEELKTQVINEYSGIGLNTSVVSLAVFNGSKAYEQIINNNAKSDKDKLQEIKNRNDMNFELAKGKFYEMTNIPWEMTDAMGSWTAFQSVPFQNKMATVMEYYANNMSKKDSPTSGVKERGLFSVPELATQDAYDLARAASQNSSSMTPKAVAAVTTNVINKVAEDINRQTPEEIVRNADVAQLNMTQLMDILPTLAVSYQDMAPQDKENFENAIQNLAKTSMKQSMRVLQSVGVPYELKGDELRPADWTTRTFNRAANNAANNFNLNLSKLKQMLPSIPNETWNTWAQEAANELRLSEEGQSAREDLSKPKDLINQAIQIQTEITSEVNEPREAISRNNPSIELPQFSLPTYTYGELMNIIEEASTEQLKELRPTILQSLMNNYMLRAYQGQPQESIIYADNIEKTLIDKKVLSKQEVDNMHGVANMFRRYRGTEGRGIPRKPELPEFNNPLNIKDTGQNWEGANGSRNGFVTFEKPEDGIKAASKIFNTYSIMHDIDTIADFIRRYAPPEENNTEEYIAAISSALGVSPDTRVDFTDEDLKARMIKAMIDVESPGRYKYTEEEIKKIIAK